MIWFKVVIEYLLIVSRRRLLLFVLFLVTHSVFAQDKLKIDVSGQVAQEELSWSISGNLNGQNPDVLSELHWYNIQAVGPTLTLKYGLLSHLSVVASCTYGYILNGDVTDTDFTEDGRKGVSFFATEKADKGSLNDGNIGVVYDFTLLQYLSFEVEGGFSLFKQRYYLVNKETGLNSTYKTSWYGPYLGIATLLGFFGDQSNQGCLYKLYLRWDMSYHQVNYSAEGNWNLIEEYKHPKSFEHTAKGFGVRNELGLCYRLNKRASLSVGLFLDYWSTGKGVDQLFRKDNTSVFTRLNEVKRSSKGIKLSILIGLITS